MKSKSICFCCKMIIVNPKGCQRYCSSCSYIHKNEREKINYLKREIGRLRTIIYGTKNGQERVRLKGEFNGI